VVSTYDVTTDIQIRVIAKQYPVVFKTMDMVLNIFISHKNKNK